MDRKQLIKALEAKYGVKAKYLGAPSFAYEVAIKEKICTIDKEGKILTASGEDLLPEELLNEAFETDSEEIEAAVDATPLEENTSENKSEVNSSEEVRSSETMSYELKLPMEGHNAKTLRNLINMIYAKQPLIKKALGADAEILTEEFVYDINQVPMETVEEFQNALEQIENYSGQGIQFDFDEKTFAFKLELEPAKVDAAINLLALVNKNALAQNYASFKVKHTTNEKYTFRTWLLRLGMIGDEYKKARKELLRSLSGNGAFKEKGKADENEKEVLEDVLEMRTSFGGDK
ncbi:virulence-related protein [Clostridium thermarum]|uniref:virulence-related protein n=1 Tax=Clostridium thermarum TaxID=1716543 RepID=UPI0011214341|nr:virulence-related protein [Clostridium thermarum]